MSKENSPEKRHGLAWPMLIVIMVLAMVGAMALALLLIPQLSVRAAVQGGTIAIGSTLATLLIPKAYRRFRQRSGRE
jgi:membrane protein implicated in regulation of membrane protease activity